MQWLDAVQRKTDSLVSLHSIPELDHLKESERERPSFSTDQELTDPQLSVGIRETSSNHFGYLGNVSVVHATGRFDHQSKNAQ